MSPTQKHLLHFEGGNALSAFRAQALLPKLQSVSSRITGVAARHVHWVWTDTVVQPDAAYAQMLFVFLAAPRKLLLEAVRDERVLGRLVVPAARVVDARGGATAAGVGPAPPVEIGRAHV